MVSTKKNLRLFISFSLRDCAITLLWLLAHTLLCIICSFLTRGHAFAPILYIQCTFVVALTTHGLLYSCFSAIFTVFLANYLFSAPRLAFTVNQDSIITYSVMLLVGLSAAIVSTIYIELKEAYRWNAVNSLFLKLLSSASHDLRTPLTSISGATSALLEEDNLSEEAKRSLLAACRDEADNLVRTVENLTTSSRIITGRFSLNVTIEIVDELLSEAISRHRSNPDNPEILATIPQEIMLAPMDSALIGQAISNLLAFVTDHCSPGKSIYIALRKEGNFARFSIRYFGRRSKCSTAGLVLDLSVSNRRRDLSDISLELSAAASIIRLHDGTFYMDDREDNGAEIIFKLPLERRTRQ